jgi:hypothetical protein
MLGNSSYRMGEVASRKAGNGYSGPIREFYSGGRVTARFPTRHMYRRILQGPSKYDLSTSLFRPSTTIPHSDELNSVEFTLEGGKVLRVKLSSVQRYDGSGDSWIFTGHSQEGDIKGYYSTKTRTGTVPLESQLGTAPGGA